MINGGAGNDTYRIGVATAQIGELTRDGFDTVEAQVSFDLATAPTVERLILGGTLAIDGWGSAANDVLIGNGQGNHLFVRDGNDRLVGRANYGSGFGGGDVLDGGDGDDQVSGGFTRVHSGSHGLAGSTPCRAATAMTGLMVVMARTC